MTLERAAGDAAPPARRAPPPPPAYQSHGGHYDQGHGHHRPHKRRKSWLEEIFD